ncbi:hypothetical protein LDENG_00045600 [Lucifuga dentata]|nr:hypothetical protein LDENG_00045600 [Lucifuga dentata]
METTRIQKRKRVSQSRTGMNCLVIQTRKRNPEKLMSANVSYGNQLFTGTCTWMIFRKSQEYCGNTQKNR